VDGGMQATIAVRASTRGAPGRVMPRPEQPSGWDYYFFFLFFFLSFFDFFAMVHHLQGLDDSSESTTKLAMNKAFPGNFNEVSEPLIRPL
jgi:hypothetical protein